MHKSLHNRGLPLYAWFGAGLSAAACFVGCQDFKAQHGAASESSSPAPDGPDASEAKQRQSGAKKQRTDQKNGAAGRELAAAFLRLKRQLDKPATPAREVINHTRSEHARQWLAQLRSKKGEAPPKQAVRYYENKVKLLRKLREFPAAPKLEAMRRKGALAIDGKLDEAAWDRAASVPIRYAGLDRVEQAVAEARVLWDKKRLYVGFTVPDRSIVAPQLDRDGDVFRYDCVELFLCPRPTKTGEYWELNVSPSGSVLDNRASKADKAWGGDMGLSADMAGLRHASTQRRGPGKAGRSSGAGYTVELAIPFAALPGMDTPAQTGDSLYILLAQADRDGAKDGPVTYLSHSPVSGWFHNIWAYLKLTLKD